MARAGMIRSPRVFSTGTILYGAAGDFKAEIESLDDARAHLRRMKAVGAISVKSYNQPRREQRQQILAAAREIGIQVVPEGGSLFQHNMTMVVDGHTGVEHSLPVARTYADVQQLWSRSGTGYTPTLIVAYGGVWGENYWYQKTNVWDDKRLLAFVPRRVVDARSRRPVMAPEDELNHFQTARVTKELNDKGVSVQLGAHGQREGLGAHWELWMFGQGGMKPQQALRAATLSGAHYLGLDGDIGSLEEGKLADLLVLEKNPLEDLRNSTSIQYTMVGGRLYESLTLNEVGGSARKREPLFFEREGQEAWGPAATVSTHED
jgi:imidazolonepropionase-like amidohydrolase